MEDPWLTMNESPDSKGFGRHPISGATRGGIKPFRALLGRLLHNTNQRSGEEGTVNPVGHVQSPSPEMSRIPSSIDAITLAPQYESRISSWQPPYSINTGEGTESDVPPTYHTDEVSHYMPHV